MTIASAGRGLTSTEAAARLARDGPNGLPAPRRPSVLSRVARELLHFFAVMLWVAAGLALIADLPALSVAIVAVIVLNAGFSFAQRTRADRTAARLRTLLPMQVTVRRDGLAVAVDATAVVVGDVLLLESGDRVAADAVVVEARAALMDTSLLTGESEPVPVEPGADLFAGTFLVEGEAVAEVTATGASTRLAAIARLTTAAHHAATPLSRELRKTVRAIAVIAVGVGAFFFAVSLLLGNPAAEGVVFAIGVTVALVPEALLPTVTLSLAWGADQMAKRNVLVRELDAVETLGSTTFICTDKTGTLTRNQMTVVEAWTPEGAARIDEAGYEPEAPVRLTGAGDGAAVQRLAMAAVRCSTGYAYLDGDVWKGHGDPMEVAIDVFARRLGLQPDGGSEHRLVARFPFDPRRRRMSVVDDGEVLVKGSPDGVLPRCEDGDVAAAEAVLETMVDRGLRVLAVAARPVAGVAPGSAEEAEAHLGLVGLLGLQDPPRRDVGAAIARCRRAGINVAMVTGDHPATASAIASEVGLSRPGGPVLVGDDLPADDAALGALLDVDGVVVARVSPEDKLRIAGALRARGHIVAMTGDGVNDGPALREADIGIAMGVSGTDIAREAADLVLLDDRFATIVAGVEQGRTTFLNIRRFLTYHLTDNVAELTPFVVWALSGGRFPLALGVLQILALDIGTDTLSAVALGAEPPSPRILDRPPVSGRLLNGTVAVRAFGVLGSTIALCSMAAFVVSFATFGWRPGQAFPTGEALAASSGAAFVTVVLAQVANAFACRSSTVSPWTLGWTTNRLLPAGTAFAVAFALVVLYVDPIAAVLGQGPPPVAGWVVALGSMAVLLGVDALYKRRRGRRRGPHR